MIMSCLLSMSKVSSSSNFPYTPSMFQATMLSLCFSLVVCAVWLVCLPLSVLGGHLLFWWFVSAWVVFLCDRLPEGDLLLLVRVGGLCAGRLCLELRVIGLACLGVVLVSRFVLCLLCVLSEFKVIWSGFVFFWSQLERMLCSVSLLAGPFCWLS